MWWTPHLIDDAERLAGPLHTTQVPVLAVAILAHRHIEFDLRTQSAQLILSTTEPPTSSSLSYGATFLRSQFTPLPRSITP